MTPPGRVHTAEVERRLARFRATARDRGIRLTPQRLEVFREVASSLEHPDAETVHRAVHARMPTVSLDTVYRTLWRLVDAGLVSTLDADRERVRFDANPDGHHHWDCIRCGLTRDFASAALRGLRLPDDIRALGRALSEHIEVRGVCRNCARRDEKRGSPSVGHSRGRKGASHGREEEEG